MTAHTPEPWVIGGWHRHQEGHKLYYVFREDPEAGEVHSGVTDGTKVHCSDFYRGRGTGVEVISMTGEYPEDAYLDLSDADVRRIVACVNACRGFDTEYLEAVAHRGKLLAVLDEDVEVRESRP